MGDLGLIPGLGRSPGEGKGYPLQYSGLENTMDCIVRAVAKSRTSPNKFHFQFITCKLPWHGEDGGDDRNSCCCSVTVTGVMQLLDMPAACSGDQIAFLHPVSPRPNTVSFSCQHASGIGFQSAKDIAHTSTEGASLLHTKAAPCQYTLTSSRLN